MFVHLFLWKRLQTGGRSGESGVYKILLGTQASSEAAEAQTSDRRNEKSPSHSVIHVMWQRSMTTAWFCVNNIGHRGSAPFI